MAKHVVAAVEDVPPGGRKLVEVAGRSIGVFNLAGEFFALRNRCPHQAGPLCTGVLGACVTSNKPGEYRVDRPGEMLRCPWHGWEFDVRTGQSWFDPKQVRVKCYEVTVAPGAALGPAEAPGGGPPPPPGLQRGPYVAESYPVSIEKNYVLVEI